jgi:hypothetical protein
MRAWLEEFLIVTDASRHLQIALFAIPVVPSLIVLFGAFQLGGAVSAGQYSTLVAAVREAALYLYLAAAAIACIACVKIASKEISSRAQAPVRTLSPSNEPGVHHEQERRSHRSKSHRKRLVNKVGGDVASRHRTQENAAERGREIARQNHSEHAIHRRDGTPKDRNK